MNKVFAFFTLTLVSSTIFAAGSIPSYSLENLAQGELQEYASKALYNYTVGFSTPYTEEDANDPVSFRSPVVAKVTCFYKSADGANCHITSLNEPAKSDLYEQESIAILNGADINQYAMKALWNYVSAVGTSSTSIDGALDAKLICSAGGVKMHACFVKSLK